MFNQEIYDHLSDKFGTFNMPLICEAIAEMYATMWFNEEAGAHKNNELKYEADWWKSATVRATEPINKDNKPA